MKVHQGAIGEEKRSRFFRDYWPSFCLAAGSFCRFAWIRFSPFSPFFPLGVFCVRRFLPSRQWDERRKKRQLEKEREWKECKGSCQGKARTKSLESIRSLVPLNPSASLPRTLSPFFLSFPQISKCSLCISLVAQLFFSGSIEKADWKERLRPGYF